MYSFNDGTECEKQSLSPRSAATHGKRSFGAPVKPPTAASVPRYAFILSVALNLLLVVGWVLTSLLAPSSSKKTVLMTPAVTERPLPPSPREITLRCQLRDIQVTIVKNATAGASNVSLEQIRLQIGTPAFEHPSNRHWSCIDGRHENEVLMTPGGDAAEFLTALATYISYSATPQDVSPQRVKAMWHPFLLNSHSAVKRFYMHTDEHAVERIAASLNVPGLNVTEFDIIKPDSAYFIKLLESVALPSFLGCGHLKLMAKNPAVYGVPSALFSNFMRLYHRTLWGMEGDDLQGRLRMDVLPGHHDENAVLVMNEKGCPGFAPVIAARFDMPHIFVTENDAVLTLRQDLIAFFVATESATLSGSASAIEDALTALGSTQLAFTVGGLASSLPVFNVMMEGEIVEDGE